MKLFGDGLSQIVSKRPRNFVAKLMELFPEKVIFRKPLVHKDGKVEMTCCVFKNADIKPMHFRGIGPNKKTAKLAAAKCAIHEMKRRNIIKKDK
jgi:hypothetical protein